MRGSGFLVITALAIGCGNDGLESATSLEPPDSDGFDPSAGYDEGGYSTTSGSASGGDEAGDDSGPTECEDANKKCPHEFTLADDGYTSVALFGNYASDGWENAIPLTLDRGTWRATVPLAWGEPTEYKFRIDDAEWVVDPANPSTVPDGAGGQNSVLEPEMCAEFTCEPDVVGTFDWRDSIIYFVFVDRFFNGDPSNDGGIGVPMASDWQGGDWAGVTAKIEEGYFQDLGVNTLWLSVPANNTNDDGIGTDGRDYSAYHGYWPTALQETEEHFGSMAELQQLIDTAHEHDLKVLFDYAMNHVHVTSTAYAEHPEWFWPNDNGSNGNCVCGDGCDWEGPNAKRCWFTDYLPDFNFNEEPALQFSIDNALWWIEQTGVDGFRLDAVKHIEDAWLLELRARVTAEVQSRTGEYFYMVGETYTGNQDLIAYYVNDEMLDGQFDFPLRMEMARTMLMRQGSMEDLAGFMDGNDNRYGPAIMSTFIGNHDIPRAIHLAEDDPVWDDQWSDGKDRAWTNIPGLPAGTSAFERMGNAFTILMTTKGAPLVYYGDEYGMPGAGDPDNRRFMQWDGHTAGQQFLYEHIQKLIQIRKSHPATRRGTRTGLSASTHTLAYRVEFGGDTVYVAINRDDQAREATGLPEGDLLDELTGTTVQGPTVMVPARSGLVLVRP